MQKLSVFFAVVFSSFIVAAVLPVLLYAQEVTDLPSEVSSSLAEYHTIVGENISEGSIISLTNNVFALSSQPYDSNAFGVVVNNPSVSIKIVEDPLAQAIVKEGVVLVNVNEESGPIKIGDKITSSSTPGVGMKATQAGKILGIAQESFPSAANQENKIKVRMSIGFDEGSAEELENMNPLQRISELLKISTRAILQDPFDALRYTLAAIITITTIVFSVYSSGRVASNGVIALGRNPLAKGVITSGILLNLVGIVCILGGGIFLSYIIIVL